MPLHGFYPAEAYHQNYATLHPDDPYIVINDAPKVAHLQSCSPTSIAGSSRARPAVVYIQRHGAWRSLVARLLWEQNVGGSNPLAPTELRSARILSNGYIFPSGAGKTSPESRRTHRLLEVVGEQLDNRRFSAEEPAFVGVVIVTTMRAAWGAPGMVIVLGLSLTCHRGTPMASNVVAGHPGVTDAASAAGPSDAGNVSRSTSAPDARERVSGGPPPVLHVVAAGDVALRRMRSEHHGRADRSAALDGSPRGRAHPG